MASRRVSARRLFTRGVSTAGVSVAKRDRITKFRVSNGRLCALGNAENRLCFKRDSSGLGLVRVGRFVSNSNCSACFSISGIKRISYGRLAIRGNNGTGVNKGVATSDVISSGMVVTGSHRGSGCR